MYNNRIEPGTEAIFSNQIAVPFQRWAPDLVILYCGNRLLYAVFSPNNANKAFAALYTRSSVDSNVELATTLILDNCMLSDFLKLRVVI